MFTCPVNSVSGFPIKCMRKNLCNLKNDFKMDGIIDRLMDELMD